MKDGSFRTTLSQRLLRFTMSATTAAFVTTCLTALAISLMAQFWLARPPAAIGSTMKVCAQAGAGRVGVIMFSPHLSSYEPPASASCVYIPWSAELPLWAHRWWFPP